MRNSSSLDWLRFMHTPNDYRVSRENGKKTDERVISGYKKKPLYLPIQGLHQKRRLPTLPLLRSTIGVTELNFSVRNGKRWNLSAIVT